MAGNDRRNIMDQEHLDLLKQGTAVWNKWRKEYPEIEPDLGGAYLYRANFTEAYLFGANLSNIYEYIRHK
jgi:uncharacterized protein YjbI with pentapeptide repeats